MLIYKKKEKINEVEHDMELLRRIHPLGGIHHMESYTRTGTGYEACIHIWDFPNMINDYWMTKLCNQENSITKIDFCTESKNEVQKNLNKSIEEQDSRKRMARNHAEFYDADKRQLEMQKLYDEIDSMGEVIKTVNIRIYVAELTIQKLETSVARIISNLESSTYRSAIFLNETESEWQARWMSAEKQLKELPHQVSGIPLTAKQIAAGNPFHFSSLEDSCGDFLGMTPAGGNVIFDEFLRTNTRVSYSALVVGKQRYGKSTMLKKRLKARALRGDFVRTFDVVGEFKHLTHTLGGRVIGMDGASGIINLLEIFRAGENADQDYSMHWKKLNAVYRFLKPMVTQEELDVFHSITEELYKRFKLLPDRSRNRKIAGLPAARYPTFSDLLDLLDSEMKELLNGSYNDIETELVKQRLLNFENVKNQISQLVNTYGFLFDGHTSVDNMDDEQIVTYDFSKIKDMDTAIFDLQIFNVLTLCWDGAITNGTIMKAEWEDDIRALEDVIHTIVLIDESHRWVNTRKIFALELLSAYIREAPKFFLGIWLASQSIRDFAPEIEDGGKGIELLKTIFEMTQYKFIFHQDENAIPVLDKVFNNSLTFAQRERIPRLEKGETILCIAGEQNLEFKVYLSEREDKLFKGGA